MLAALLVAGPLAGCGADAAMPGGAASLPGPPPAAVLLRPAPGGAPPAPPLRASLVDGTSLDAATLWSNRAVVLVFFASWCDTCARWQDGFSTLARRYAGSVTFLGVAADDEPDRLHAYLRRHRVPYPVALDQNRAVRRAYAVADPPAVVLIGRGGGLLRGWTGGIEPAALDARLHQLVLP
jgi:peroxiredoxin